jgi:hypothetical protein
MNQNPIISEIMAARGTWITLHPGKSPGVIRLSSDADESLCSYVNDGRPLGNPEIETAHGRKVHGMDVIVDPNQKARVCVDQ